MSFTSEKEIKREKKQDTYECISIKFVYRLIKFGHCFCGSASDTLQESLKKKCWSYFHSYHLARLEELQMHLENEGWALCPVRDTFRAQQLVVSEA